MAKQPYGVTVGNNIRKFIFLTTDNTNTYPTADECSAGSSILLKNDETKKIVGALFFDGTDWNTIWAAV